MVVVIFSNDDSQKPLSWQQVTAAQPSCSPDRGKPWSELPVTSSDTSYKVNYLSGLLEPARLESDIGGGGRVCEFEMSRGLILMARFFRSESSSRTRTCPSKWNPKSLEIAWSCWIAKWLVIVLEACKYTIWQFGNYVSMQACYYLSI